MVSNTMNEVTDGDEDYKLMVEATVKVCKPLAFDKLLEKLKDDKSRL